MVMIFNKNIDTFLIVIIFAIIVFVIIKKLGYVEMIYGKFRVKKENSLEKPTLLLIDGGEGQVSSVNSVIQGFVPVAGIIKDRRNVKGMELLIDGKGNELVLQNTAFAVVLKTIRNETHRFSITFNRELRKGKLELPFSKIKGIGKARENALLEKFRTISAIKEATVQELTEIPGITEDLAEKILKTLDS